MIIRRVLATLWLMSLATTGCWNPTEAPPKVAIETDLVQFKDLSHQPAEQTGQKEQEDKAARRTAGHPVPLQLRNQKPPGA
ncbi:MAG: hypothetical protein R2857_02535 [Vampirovibrionales bacterium]